MPESVVTTSYKRIETTSSPGNNRWFYSWIEEVHLLKLAGPYGEENILYRCDGLSHTRRHLAATGFGIDQQLVCQPPGPGGKIVPRHSTVENERAAQQREGLLFCRA